MPLVDKFRHPFCAARFVLIISTCSLPGEYIFAVASDNNAEFWLSSDESTKNIKLMAYLGKVNNYSGMTLVHKGEHR